LSKSELEAISLRELSTSATTFSTASPVEYAFVNHADRATVERITSEYFEAGYFQPDRFDLTSYTIAAAWVRLDPNAGLNLCEEIADPDLRQRWARALIMAWLENDFGTAYQAITQLSIKMSGNQRFAEELIDEFLTASNALPDNLEKLIDLNKLPDRQLGMIATTLAAQDVERARALLPLLSPEQRGSVEAAILIPLAQSDPIAALDTVERMPTASQTQALNNVYRIWAQQDAYSAATHAFANNAPNRALKAIVLSWADQDVPALHQFMASNVSETERAVLLRAAFDSVGGSNRLQQMAPLIDLIPAGDARDYTVGIYLRHNYSSDPRAALERAKAEIAQGATFQMTSNLLRARGMTDAAAREIIDKLAPGDLDKVAQSLSHAQQQQGISDEFRFQLVTKIANEGERQWAVANVLEQITKKDPTNAIQILARLKDEPEELENYYGSVAHSWALKDPDTALAWAFSLENEDLRKNSVSRAIGGISYNSPELALEKILSFADAGIRRSALETIAWPVANRNPEAFARQISEMPDEEVSPKVYRNIAAAWTEKDPLSGSKWIDSLPSGQNRDQAISGLVDKLRSSDPSSAFVWASSIEADRNRRQMLRNSLYSLVRQDLDTAIALFNEAELSEQDRKSIQNVLPKHARPQ
ncbi:MAG: hypothetical protein AAF546_08430, partial [Verrucomicrobiota bacterium]